MSPASIIDGSLLSVFKHLNTEKFRGKKIFVTGGTGFFGLWLLSAFRLLHTQQLDIQVTVLSRNPDKFLTKSPGWASEPWLTFVRGDVKDFVIGNARFDYLIHAATDTSAQAHIDPVAIFDDVAQGSRRGLEFVVNAGIQRAFLTSSGAV